MKRTMKKNTRFSFLFLLMCFMPASFLLGCQDPQPLDPSWNGFYAYTTGVPWGIGFATLAVDPTNNVLWSEGAGGVTNVMVYNPDGSQEYFPLTPLPFAATCVGYQELNGKIISFCYRVPVERDGYKYSHAIITTTPTVARDDNKCLLELNSSGVVFFTKEGEWGWGYMKPLGQFHLIRAPYDETDPDDPFNELSNCTIVDTNKILSYFCETIFEPGTWGLQLCKDQYKTYSSSSSSSSGSFSTLADNKSFLDFNLEATINNEKSDTSLNDLSIMATGTDPLYTKMKNEFLNSAWDEWIEKENQLGPGSLMNLEEVRQKLGDNLFNRQMIILKEELFTMLGDEIF